MIDLTVGGIDISAEKKQIKNMYIRVIPPDGKVKITAPMSATEDAIRMFKKRMPQATQQFAHDDTLSIRKEADHSLDRKSVV